MAKLSKKEFLDKAKALIGDRNDDEALSFLEDCSDTISDVDDSSWEAKYNEQVEANKQLEETWRNKYRERFFSTDDTHNNTKTEPKPITTPDPKNDSEDDKIEKAESVTFDDLFKGEEK